jgi:signal transduction histidine kinase
MRWKLVGLFFLSAGLSVVTTAGLAVVALLLYEIHWLPFRGIVSFLFYNVGAVPTMIIVSLILFVFYVIVLSLRHIRYLGEIGRAVQKLSTGELDFKIPIRTKDEMGKLAENINIMSAKLKSSMEEERQAVQAKQELVTNVSHDLRTPLTSIKGYLQYIHENRYKDEVELMYYADIAYQKTLRLERMVNDLFEYTRVAHGQTKLKLAPIDLKELLGQLCVELRLMAEEAGMVIEMEGPVERVMVLADGDKLVRVFENLISNAVRYGQDGRRVDIRLSQAGGMARVDVINYGEPIPQKDLPFIFERFHRVDKSRSADTGGTGLGLAIARNIVELHQGTITASSDEAQTCFTVRLPIAQNSH